MPASAANKHFHARGATIGLTLLLTLFSALAAGGLLEYVLARCARIPLPGFYIRLLESQVGAYLWWLSDVAYHILLLAVLCTAPFGFFWLFWWKRPVKCDTCGARYTITKSREDNHATYTYRCNGCRTFETYWYT